VAFTSDLLLMRDREHEGTVERAKVDGLRRLRERGYIVVAVVDNEPSNIVAMAAEDASGDALFLHADTIFDSQRQPMPRSVSGSSYGLSALVDEAEMARRVTFVWHGVNRDENLRAFLASEVRWAEADVRRDPRGRLVLRHDAFTTTPWHRQEHPLTLAAFLETMRWEGRSVKLDLKESASVLDESLALVARFGFGDEELWFNASIETLGEGGFARVREAHPGAIRSAPLDFLVPLLIAAPDAAAAVLSLLRRWGMSRASLCWSTPEVREAMSVVETLGWHVNLYGVPDLESFLDAALLLPASVTADFNFPEWNYFGIGAGRDGVFHRYERVSSHGRRRPA
jgi:hypothetical protein